MVIIFHTMALIVRPGAKPPSSKLKNGECSVPQEFNKSKKTPGLQDGAKFNSCLYSARRG